MACRVPISDVAKAIDRLREDGGVILTGFATPQEVTRVNDDAAPYLEAVAKERTLKGQPGGTLRCHRLFGRSQTAREKWMQRSEVSQILNHFLKTSSIPYNDQGNCTIETDPVLSSSAAMEISPGEKAQDLHRDDFIWQKTHYSDEGCYKPESDVSMGIIVAGTETTMRNGATVFIPKSHRWDHSRRPNQDEACYAAMSVGEAFVFLGSTVHGGGTNTTEQSRVVHGFFFCRSWMRPEENQFLWWSKEEVETWSRAAQRQAGYLLGNPFLGHCDESDPVGMFRACETLEDRGGG
ncbi:MAG: hypothetical protein LQ349_003698 [Xanthoria aureola]|nr:MAG: hypothetical protein LQ349_003698 [Xanthoria aureola]